VQAANLKEYNVYVLPAAEDIRDPDKPEYLCATNSEEHTSDSGYTKTLTCTSTKTGKCVALPMLAYYLACSC